MSQLTSVTCFGVTFNQKLISHSASGGQSLSSSDNLANQISEEAASLNKCFEISIKETQGAIKDDSSGLPRSMQSAFLPGFSRQDGITEITGVSLIQDCGLPLVSGRFGVFFDSFLQNEVSANNIPFVGLSTDTSNHLWSPGILPINPVRHRDLLDYNSQLYFLTRLNRSDPVWNTPRKQAWINGFGKELLSYTRELFCGRFVDRNGVANGFSSKGILKGALDDLPSFDPKSISPQIVGNLMSVFTEYLGDKMFGIPFYSPEILKTNRDFRSIRAKIAKNRAYSDILRNCLMSGSISVADAKKVLSYDSNTPDPLPVILDPIVNNGIATGISKNELYRLAVRGLAELDGEGSSLLKNLRAMSDELDLVDARTSDLQTRFTCFSTNVITEHLHCVFNEASSRCGRSDHTGNTEGANVDYADLLGRLISFGASLTEKNVRSLMGGIIRGISIASLQNEVVAELLSSIASGLAKKAVENVIFKGFQRFVSERGGSATLPIHTQIFLERLSIEHKLTKDWSGHLKASFKDHLGNLQKKGR